LARYPDLPGDVPLDFVQNKEPKIRVDDLMPVEWPADPELEWCPPGHGDIYTALVTSRMLEALLEHGYEYAVMSNSDNLGAVLEPRILAWLAAERIPFLMEVADRTEADRKGGHLARRPDGRLLLREIAQTPEPDHAAFQDISRHRYFNTNTLWLNLRALSETLRARGNILGLPLIVNTKTVDPTDPSSPSVYQLETAMGAAIEVFEGARALRVPRERFAPVKTTNDLLVLRSDCYVLTEDAHVVLAPERTDGPPLVDLDPLHYKLLAEFEARFPAGPPSLRGAHRFVVRGDVVFGAGVVVTGDVEVEAAAPDRQVLIDDGTVLGG
jgi:UTP--glucose-1-phosphate uridylyltransferase